MEVKQMKRKEQMWEEWKEPVRRMSIGRSAGGWGGAGSLERDS
jgi:hypothetical protein